MGDVTRMDDVVSVAIWEIGGTPPPNFFVKKMLFFTYFTQIRTHCSASELHCMYSQSLQHTQCAF